MITYTGNGTRITAIGEPDAAELIQSTTSLSQIEHLSLDSCKIADDDVIAMLSNLRQCSSLWIKFCPITDRLFDHRLVQQVAIVSLLDLDIGDTALVRISRFPNLLSLRVARCGISSESVTELSRSHKLRYLYLEHCNLADSMSSSLPFLPQLISLSLSGNPITDTACANIRRLSDLESLFMSDTMITDRGALAFINLKHLQDLRLANTSITGKAISAIIAALPKLRNLDLRNVSAHDIDTNFPGYLFVDM